LALTVCDRLWANLFSFASLSLPEQWVEESLSYDSTEVCRAAGRFSRMGALGTLCCGEHLMLPAGRVRRDLGNRQHV